MIIRKAKDRGVANFGWLHSQHTFSFGHYYDPLHMGFGPLRVINDDRVQPGGGFPTHGHADMEIISYVVEGGLEHKDSIGTGSIILPGEVQRMSAGTGIRHSEYNASQTEPVRFLQIWIQPAALGIKPGYEQKRFFPVDNTAENPAEGSGQLVSTNNDGIKLVGSPDGRDNTLTIHQDVLMYAARLQPGSKQVFTLPAGRIAWVQVVKGSVLLNDAKLSEGDGAAFREPGDLTFTDADGAEVLIFAMEAYLQNQK